MSDAGSFTAIPLGGLGHVGGNMMAYETADDLVAIDCGILFPTADQPGVDYIIPDVGYLVERKSKLRGIVLTHGHEDHIGALPYILPQLDVPIYGTRFTLALLEGKLGEHPALEPNLRLIQDRVPFPVGGLTFEPIPVTHSIPDAVAFSIRTPIGTVIHTGDFKLDGRPLDGRRTDVEALRQLGDTGVIALFSDSTNAEKPGHAWDEHEIGETLEPLVAGATRRVIVTAFASHIHRVQMIVTASERAGRKIVLVGRSMQQNVQLALERGFLKAHFGAFVDASEFERLPPREVTVIASGSQGEPESAMTRIATGRHGQVRVEAGDRVILSSRRIPGNERAIGSMVNHLFRLDVEVIDDRSARVHASGHAFNDEQREIIDLCRPRFFVPIHGEYRHLVRHAALAREAGIVAQNVSVIEDGQPLHFSRHGADVRMRRGVAVQAGHVFVDGKGVGDIGEIVLRDRRVLAETGMVLCVVILREDGVVVGGPDLVTRGVLHVDANQALLARAAEEVRTVVERREGFADAADCGERIRQVLRRFFRRELDRRPLILPVVMSI